MILKQITERDKKDYFLADANNLEKIVKSLTKEEKTDEKGNSLSGSEIYNVQLSKVTEADINFNEQQMFTVKLFKEMNSTTILDKRLLQSTIRRIEDIGENEGEIVGHFGRNQLEPQICGYSA